MWYVCDVYAVLYVCVCCFVVCGCAVSRRYIDVCYCDVFSVVNVCLGHMKFCVVCINALCNLSLRTVVKLCTLGVLTLGVSLVS